MEAEKPATTEGVDAVGNEEIEAVVAVGTGAAAKVAVVEEEEEATPAGGLFIVFVSPNVIYSLADIHMRSRLM